ncbi:hypothetical protein STRDD11_00076 [Streptococcus sp. DD11]|nr:hypothetical protein STRDD11_00076 [Streptococcus sp. DD11]
MIIRNEAIYFLPFFLVLFLISCVIIRTIENVNFKGEMINGT